MINLKLIPTLGLIALLGTPGLVFAEHGDDFPASSFDKDNIVVDTKKNDISNEEMDKWKDWKDWKEWKAAQKTTQKTTKSQQ